MPTPSEQKALVFVAIVILLGGVARIVRAGALGPPPPTPAEQQGLRRQAFAASSTAVLQQASKGGRRAKAPRAGARRRRTTVDTVAGVAGVPFSDVRPGRVPATPWPGSSAANRLGYPPPNPRVDSDFGASPRPDPSSGPAGSRKGAADAAPVDMDAATEAQIESLPRVGPALARRIVANRDSLGPFGSLTALHRVRGIGPATLKLLAPRVTFSGQVRH